MITKYQHLSDDEFLAVISQRIGYSPIIDELYQRFIRVTDRATCPICEAVKEEIDDIPF